MRDAITVRKLNAYMGTDYRIEDLNDWEQWRIEQLEAFIDMTTGTPKKSSEQQHVKHD